MSTIGRALLQTGRRYSGKAAMLDGEETHTWAQLIERVGRLASVLHELGLKPGNRLGVLSLNSVNQAELLFACYWSGVVAVPVNLRLAPGEIAEVLRNADCTWVAVDEVGAALCNADELSKWQDKQLLLQKDAITARIDAANPLTLFDSDADSTALLLYTGGTTGKAKGVPLSHRNILSNALQVNYAWPGSADDIVLHVAPMFHSADLVMTHLVLRGAAHVYLSKFTPLALLHAIERYAVTATMMVPTMLMMLIRHGLSGDCNISTLRRILYGASAMSRSSIEAAMCMFPNVEFTQGYGLTETAPLISMLDHKAHLSSLAMPESDRIRSCGQPLPAVDIKIVSETNEELAPGNMGEIVARGPNVFNGYLGGGESLRGDWLHTGDMGKIDQEGFLYVLDRMKDVIKVAGESVCSSDVEETVITHPDILECAVIGIPAASFGEKVLAVIVCTEDRTVTRREIREFCRGKIGDFKIPTAVECVSELPKSAMGKTLKSVLRSKFGDQQSDLDA